MSSSANYEQTVNSAFGWEAKLALQPANHVLYTLRDGNGGHRGRWNYVFVRVTYKDDTKWSTFMGKIKAQNDRNNLDDATLAQATFYFQETIKSLVKENNIQKNGRKSGFYVYVNEESLESVVNLIRVAEKTGNFLILVHVAHNVEDQLMPISEIPHTDSDDGDWSFKLISAKDLTYFYSENIKDPNSWFTLENMTFGPPFIFETHLESEYRDLIETSDLAGYDAYTMLKRMYGTGHWRSKAFVEEEAKSSKQRITGVDGEKPFC